MRVLGFDLLYLPIGVQGLQEEFQRISEEDALGMFLEIFHECAVRFEKLSMVGEAFERRGREWRLGHGKDLGNDIPEVWLTNQSIVGARFPRPNLLRVPNHPERDDMGRSLTY